MNEKDELKPCPFCGSNNIIVPQGENGWMCRRCGSMAYRSWNSRPMETAMEIRIKELETNYLSISQMILDLYTMHVFIKEKMKDYDLGTRFLVKLANDWVCPATYTSNGWIDDNGNELISVTHYMVMPGVLS